MKKLFDLTIDAIKNDLNYQFEVCKKFDFMIPTFQPFNFEVLWNVVASGVHFKDLFVNPQDEDDFNDLLDEMNEIFYYDLNNMSIGDIYAAGFDIARIIIKDSRLDNFIYDNEKQLFIYKK